MAIVTAITMLLADPAVAQTAPAPAEMVRAIPLGTGVVPNANGPEMWFGTPGNLGVRNTTEATLLPILPDPAKATGSAMVVAPGGGLMSLSWDAEGVKVARALADRGIAAFVLKYRLDPTPRDGAAFTKFAAARMSNWFTTPGAGLRITPQAYSIADGVAALRLVRKRAAEWRIDPARVGMIGFSSGSRVTLRITLDAAAADRPAITALIYPPMEGVFVPADAPPLFVAMASDDPLSGRAGYALIDSWNTARRPVEFHAYQRGGHGFALGLPGTTTEGWIEGLVRWLDMNGFGKKVK